MKLFKYGFFAFTLLIAVQLYGQVVAPSVRCVAVNPVGDVTLTWEIPPDPFTQFSSYEIYYSTGGPYLLLISLNTYTQTSFPHVGANAESNTLSYYMRTGYNGGSNFSASSDTLRTMILTLDNSMQGKAKLDWNPIHTPNLITSLAKYYIHKKVGVGGAWNMIDSTNYGTETFIDYLDECMCSDSIFYRVEIGDSAGCFSVSTWGAELFEDNTPPDSPIIDSVSVEASSGQVFINWQPSANCDTEGYIITYNDGGNWIILDTLWGVNNTFYTHSTADANNRSEQYGIAAFDSCWSGSPFSPNTSATDILHRTVFLQGTMDQCERSITLVWNQYEQWPSGVEEYEILYSVDAGPWTLLTTTAANETYFVHNNLIPYATYCYRIRAGETNGDRTSTSNELCITMYIPQAPAMHYLKNVTVASGNSVELSFYVDLNADVLFYDIQRSLKESGDFQSIGQELLGSSAIITFTDNLAKPEERVYYYRVVVVDICNKEIRYSNVSRTMQLVGAANSAELKNILKWNGYSDWDTYGNGVAYYNIYRGTDMYDFEPQPLATLPSNQTEFIDNVTEEYESSGRFCYYIQAVESNGNIYNFKEVSFSNILCVTVKPRIFIPNAFTPNSDNVNDEFRPTGSFIDRSDYYFAVFDRWGHRVFQTTDVERGWDGTYLNTAVKQGVYVYHVVFTDAEGEKIRKRGSITLIR